MVRNIQHLATLSKWIIASRCPHNFFFSMITVSYFIRNLPQKNRRDWTTIGQFGYTMYLVGFFVYYVPSWIFYESKDLILWPLTPLNLKNSMLITGPKSSGHVHYSFATKIAPSLNVQLIQYIVLLVLNNDNVQLQNRPCSQQTIMYSTKQ